MITAIAVAVHIVLVTAFGVAMVLFLREEFRSPITRGKR
jgi:hypothetical protein